jgi:hypothetical protein
VVSFKRAPTPVGIGTKVGNELLPQKWMASHVGCAVVVFTLDEYWVLQRRR